MMAAPNLKHKKVKIGWGLVRVSSKAQANVQSGSLEQQQNIINRWAQRESENSPNFDYKIERIIEEDISGREESLKKRQGLKELRHAIKNKRIDFFVVEKIDRLSRDQNTNNLIIKLADENEVEIFETESGRINLKDRGSRLSYNIKNIWSEDYSFELEEKVTKKQREARVNNGKDTSSAATLGIDLHPSKVGIYVINPAEQVIITDIFEKFIQLGSLKALEKYCGEKGYRTKVRFTKEKIDRDGNRVPSRKVGGEPFDSKSLVYHLKNHKYLGYSFFKDSWEQFPKLRDEKGFVRWNYAHGAVVPEKLFLDVQAQLESNKLKQEKTHKNGRVYLLSGILKCPDGSRFSGEAPKRGAIRYYHNSKNKIRLNADELDAAIISRVKTYLSDSGLLEQVIKSSINEGPTEMDAIINEISGLKNAISIAQTKVDNFSKVLQQLAADGTDKIIAVTTQLMGEKQKAEQEIPDLEKKIEVLERRKKALGENIKESNVAVFLKKALASFDSEPDNHKKTIIHRIIGEIVYHKDGNRLELKVNINPGQGRHKTGGKVQELEEWRCDSPLWRTQVSTAPSH